MDAFDFIPRGISRFAIALLTKPLRQYNLKVPNDLANLKRHIRLCDVILVEGNERISEVIKYLTQSSWSHSALYVGDEPLRRDPELRAELLDRFGDEANHLVIEALVESGVILSPLSKYRDFNLRVCRPHNLAPDDSRRLIDEALGEVGYTYDLKNVFDLARYFLPVSLIPRRLRRTALRFGSGEPTRVICSSIIGDLFQRVRFPIVPSFKELPFAPASSKPPNLRWRLANVPDARYFGVFRLVSPTLITPRDFDLSPYFEIVKFNLVEDLRFDYRRLKWADDEPLSLAERVETDPVAAVRGSKLPV
jgi:hypothetical protein